MPESSFRHSSWKHLPCRDIANSRVYRLNAALGAHQRGSSNRATLLYSPRYGVTFMVWKSNGKHV
jgi:hypothetical protein